MVFFDVAKWTANSDEVLANVKDKLGQAPLIVRSSARTEDGLEASNAGRYLSIANVESYDGLRYAVAQVVESYGVAASSTDQVLVQPMATNLRGAGVALTRDHITGLPYTVVNLSEAGGTDIVTGGRSNIRSFTYVKDLSVNPPAALHQLSILIDEMEAKFQDAPLDLEFGLDDLGVVLFQLRPIACCRPHVRFASKHLLLKHLQKVASGIRAAMLAGDAGKLAPSCFGVMPDWNPAEMIGMKPTPLAYSLYNEMLMKRAWAEGRARYGYKNLVGRPLMYQFGGTPYIDIRASLYSLLPACLADETARTLVLASCEEIRRRPELHDKVEFALFPTCFAPDMNEAGRYPAVERLTAQERSCFRAAVDALTNSLFRRFASDIRRLERVRVLAYSAPPRPQSVTSEVKLRAALDKLNIAKTKVAPLFSSIARAAFAGTSILRGLRACELVPSDLLDEILLSLNTVSARVARDLTTLPHDEFLSLHGHIRPGTYDIRVARYDEDFDGYFGNHGCPRAPTSPSKIPGIPKLGDYLAAAGIELRSHGLIQFVRQSIWAREELKYLYAKLVSDALADLSAFGNDRGLSREDLCYLDFDALTAESRGDGAVSLDRVIAIGKERWVENRDLRMPALLFHASDVFSFEDIRSSPNFVTGKRVVGSLRPPTAGDIAGNIVLIEQADPGYDWIFNHSIAGIVTAFGGSNSHMTVRAREFNVPAAVGIGNTLFERLRRSSRILLACDERRIEVLQ